MRLINKTVAGAVLLSSMSLSAIAQQVPNGGFEDEWVDCTPWNSAGSTQVQGTQPKGWVISNVGNPSAARITMGKNVAGNNSNSAVELTNGYKFKNIPAYMTLGTPWSTAEGITAKNKDGGTFGGINFTHRPDAIAFDYIFTKGAKASVIAYLWKGNWEQADVPGEIVMSGTAKKVTMTNRDRCVLKYSLDGCQGGDVTGDGVLIASINDYISENTTEWTHCIKEFNYEPNSEETPEMINIILAADDYFADPSKGNSITIDNVALVYYSRLSSLKVGDKEVALEKDKYDYDVDAEMPADENAFSFVALGKSAKAAVTLDKVNNKATITVSNDGTDHDGALSHVYTLAFKAPQEESGDAKTYSGFLNIAMMGESLTEKPQAANVVITPTSDNTCTFSLPDFKLGEGEDAMPIGDITVPGVKMTTENGITTYTGSVNGMKLAEGAITANVSITGTTTEEGKINMKINVVWVQENEEDNIPIEVTFSSDETVAISDICIDNSNAPVEYFNLQGVRVDGENLTPGIYVRRQGNATSKILVK